LEIDNDHLLTCNIRTGKRDVVESVYEAISAKTHRVPFMADLNRNARSMVRNVLARLKPL